MALQGGVIALFGGAKCGDQLHNELKRCAKAALADVLLGSIHGGRTWEVSIVSFHQQSAQTYSLLSI